MEGKNCFRTRWMQEPLFSGGNIVTLALPYPSSFGDGDAAHVRSPHCAPRYTEALVLACGDRVNVVDVDTGALYCCYTLPLEDVILHLDAVSVLSSGTGVNTQAAQDALVDTSADASRADRRSLCINTESTGTRAGSLTSDASGAEQSAELPVASSVPCGSYIAVGTRSLQIYVLRVDVMASPIVRTMAEADGAEKEQQPQEESNINTIASSDEDTHALHDFNITDKDSCAVSYTCTLVQSWTAAQHAIALVCFADTAHALISCSTDGGIKVWDVFHHHLTHNLRCPTPSRVTAVHLNRSATRLVVGNTEGYVCVFDFVRKKVLGEVRAHVQSVEAVTTSACGSYAESNVLFSVGQDRKVTVLRIDAESQRVLVERTIALKEHVSCAVFEPVAPQTSTSSSAGVALGRGSALNSRQPAPTPRCSKGSAKHNHDAMQEMAQGEHIHAHAHTVGGMEEGNEKSASALHVHVGSADGAVVTYTVDAESPLRVWARRAANPVARAESHTEEAFVRSLAVAQRPKGVEATCPCRSCVKERRMTCKERAECVDTNAAEVNMPRASSRRARTGRNTSKTSATSEASNKLLMNQVTPTRTQDEDDDEQDTHARKRRSDHARAESNRRIDSEHVIRSEADHVSTAHFRHRRTETNDTSSYTRPVARPALYVADAGFNIRGLIVSDDAEGNSSCATAAAASATTRVCGVRRYAVTHTLVCFLDQVLDVKLLPPLYRLPDASMQSDDVRLKPHDTPPCRGRIGGPDDRVRVVVSNSNEVRLYGTSGSVSRHVLQGHTDTVLCCAVSGDGRLIATAGKDTSVRVWCTRTFANVAVGVKGHTADVTALCFDAPHAASLPATASLTKVSDRVVSAAPRRCSLVCPWMRICVCGMWHMTCFLT